MASDALRKWTRGSNSPPLENLSGQNPSNADGESTSEPSFTELRGLSSHPRSSEDSPHVGFKPSLIQLLPHLDFQGAIFTKGCCQLPFSSRGTQRTSRSTLLSAKFHVGVKISLPAGNSYLTHKCSLFVCLNALFHHDCQLRIASSKADKEKTNPKPSKWWAWMLSLCTPLAPQPQESFRFDVQATENAVQIRSSVKWGQRLMEMYSW